MTIISVKQVPDRTFETTTSKTTGSRVFEVQTDVALTEEQLILAAVDPVTALAIPAVGDKWNLFYFTTLVQDYSFDELDEGFGRAVTVKYSTIDIEKVDPTEDEWQITIGEQDKTLDLRQDPITGANVANTAGDPTPVPITDSDVIITIKRNISPDDWKDKDIFKFKKSQNEEAVNINGVTYAARQLLLWNIQTDATVKKRNNIDYYEQTLTILAHDDEPIKDQEGNVIATYGWVVVLLNAGLRQKIDDKDGNAQLVPIITADKVPTTIPLPLDINGAAITIMNGSKSYNYEYNTFFLYREEIWLPLNLE